MLLIEVRSRILQYDTIPIDERHSGAAIPGRDESWWMRTQGSHTGKYTTGSVQTELSSNMKIQNDVSHLLEAL
jgi:hypothetical protein